MRANVKVPTAEAPKAHEHQMSPANATDDQGVTHAVVGACVSEAHNLRRIVARAQHA